MNIQEFETLSYNHLPIKIFIFDNGGYLSIRTTQNAYFDGNLVGESVESGVGIPDFVRVAKAYGLQAFHIQDHKNLGKIDQIISTANPVVCVVHMDPNQTFIPRITSKKLDNGQMVSCPLEDMYPFLDAEEFSSNMLIPNWRGDNNELY
jgi:acetolactate synthase-1/2/3 large subunit